MRENTSICCRFAVGLLLGALALSAAATEPMEVYVDAQTDWPLTYDGEGTFDQEQTDGSYGSCGC